MGADLTIGLWLKKRGWLLPAILLIGLIAGVILSPKWVAARGPGSAAGSPVPEIQADGPAEREGPRSSSKLLAAPVAIPLVVACAVLSMAVLRRRRQAAM